MMLCAEEHPRSSAILNRAVRVRVGPPKTNVHVEVSDNAEAEAEREMI